MSTPTKSCPACGADLSVGTTAMPGVCPACGRDLRLEEIAVKLTHSDDETTNRAPPLSWSECLLAVVLIGWWLPFVLGLLLPRMAEDRIFFIGLVLASNMFLGLFTTGYFSRTIESQLLWGLLLSVLFGGTSLGLIYVGSSKF